MTLTEAVLSVVKEMEAEANGEDREEFEHTAAALHRYVRKLNNAICTYDQLLEGVDTKTGESVDIVVSIAEEKEKQVISKDAIGLLSDVLDMER